MEQEKRILELEARLAGVRAIKDHLKVALRDVAPNHELVNPYDENPALVAIYEQARSQHVDEERRREKEKAERQKVVFAKLKAEQRRGNLMAVGLVIAAIFIVYLFLR